MDDSGVYQEIRELAHTMVRLEVWAREAGAQWQWVRVGELQQEREEVQQRRSQLMREVWAPRRRREYETQGRGVSTQSW